MYVRATDKQRDEIDRALRPPAKINPETGLPYSWGDDDGEESTFDDWFG